MDEPTPPLQGAELRALILGTRLPVTRDAVKTLLFARWGWDRLRDLDPHDAGPWTPDLDPADTHHDD